MAENSTDLVHHVWPDLDITPGKFDVGVIASFGKLIPKKLIDMFPRYDLTRVVPFDGAIYCISRTL